MFSVYRMPAAECHTSVLASPVTHNRGPHNGVGRICTSARVAAQQRLWPRPLIGCLEIAPFFAERSQLSSRAILKGTVWSDGSISTFVFSSSSSSSLTDTKPANPFWRPSLKGDNREAGTDQFPSYYASHSVLHTLHYFSF